MVQPALVTPRDEQLPKARLLHFLILAIGLPVEFFRGIFRRNRERRPPRNVLFVSRYHLGDFLMSVPALSLARRGLPPETTMTVVLQQRYIGQMDLSEVTDHAVPEVDESQSFSRQVTDWLQRFRQGNYDAVVFHRITRPDFPAVVAAFLANVPYRVGGADKGTSGLLTDLYSPTGREHVVDYHLNLVKAWLELAPSVGAFTWPPLVDAPSSVRPCDVVIAPFAQHSKIWPIESWRELLSWMESRNLKVALSATPAFSEQSRQLLHGFSNIEDLSETTGTLADLFATVRRTRLLIAVDTGIRHVAAAVGTPCIVLGQGREHLATLGKYVETERYLMKMVPCAPCGAEPCPLGHLQCVRGITVEDVKAAIQELTPEIVAGSSV